VASLEATHDTLPSPSNNANPRWKRWTARALLVIFCVGIALSVVSIWMRNQIDDTDRYMRTVGPLASDPAIQEAIVTRVTNRFSEFLNETTTRETLVDRQRYLAAPLTSLLNEFVEDTVRSFVTSDEFPQYWNRANELAHPMVSAILTGTGTENLTAADGKITLDLTPLVEAIKGKLRDRGIDFFDRVPGDQLDPQFVIVDSPELAKAQDWVDVLYSLAYILPVVSLLAVAGYIWLSIDRRSAVMWSGLGLAIAMVGLLMLLSSGRSLYIEGLDSDVSKNATSAFFDTIGRYFRYGAQLIAVAGLVIAAVAILTRPGSWARQERSVIEKQFSVAWQRARARFHRPELAGGSFEQWRAALLAALLVICVIAIVWWNHTAFAWAITLVLIIAAGYTANRLLFSSSMNFQSIPATTIPAESAPPSIPANETRAPRAKRGEAGEAAATPLSSVARELSPEDLQLLEQLAMRLRGSAKM
jgi:hypothetical protein